MGLLKRMSDRKRRSVYRVTEDDDAVIANEEEIARPPASFPDFGSNFTPVLTPATVANLSLNEKESEDEITAENDDEEPEQECLLVGIDFGTT